jgi:hypothetical protein
MKSFNRYFLFLIIAVSAFSIGCDSQQSEIIQSDFAEIGPGIGTIQTSTIPEFFNYSVIGGEEVTLNGSMMTVKEANDPYLNANVHSNKSVILNGDYITVKGFVTYYEYITIDGEYIRIIPNDNPNNLPPYYQTSPIHMPYLNLEQYKYMADTVYYEDQQLYGIIYLGTQSNPAVLYFSDKLFLDDVQFNGYGVILVEDDVEIVSNVVSMSPHPDYSKVLIVTGGKLILNNSNTSLHSAVYTNDEININAEYSFVEGSLAAYKKNTLNADNVNVHYKPVYSGLSDLIFETNLINLQSNSEYQ